VAAQQAPQGMSWARINLLLGLIGVVLLLLLVWPAQVPEQTRLTALDIQRVASIRIERSDRLVLSFQRSDAGWQITYPAPSAAQARRVEQLLAVAGAPVQQQFSTAGKLADYGLDQPTAVLHLDGLRLAFGDRDPIQRSRYVLVNGQVCVIDDLYFNLLTLPVRHFAAD
jgi:hypothetical protein